MLLLWENSGSGNISLSSFSSLSFSFSTCSFSWGAATRKRNLWQLLLCQKAICRTVTVTICQIMPTESVECAWVPGYSAENCSHPELQRIWTLMPEEEIIKMGVIPLLQAWPVMWHSVIPFPWTILPWKVGNTRLLEILSWDAVIYGVNCVAPPPTPNWLLCKLALNWNGDLNFSDCFPLNAEKHILENKWEVAAIWKEKHSPFSTWRRMLKVYTNTKLYMGTKIHHVPMQKWNCF